MASPRRPIRTRPALLALTGVLTLVSCADDGSTSTHDPALASTVADPSGGSPTTDPSTEPASDPVAGDPVDHAGGPIPVVFDYSPTISDIGALLYVAEHPGIDLLAVTLPGTGEATCAPAVEATRSVLDTLDHPAISIGCGRTEPLGGDAQPWPTEFRAGADALVDDLLPDGSSTTEPADAEQILTDTLRTADAPVTILAVGPLTNVAAVLIADPSLAGQIERIVIMAGAVDVPGNVADAPTAEWNAAADPEALRLVVESGVRIDLVPLDATDDVPLTTTTIGKVGAIDTAAGHVATTTLGRLDSVDGWYQWDETAAVAVAAPEYLVWEDRPITVTDDGSTVADDSDGTTVRVVVRALADAVIDEWLRVLNGGTPVEIAPLDDAEFAYATAAEAAVDEAFSAMWTEDTPAGDTYAEHLDALFTVFAGLHADLSTLDAPSSFAAEHDRLVAALDALIAFHPELVDRLPDGPVGDDVDTVIEQAAGPDGEAIIGEFYEACGALDQASVLRGGPSICGE